jgi:hypothetical protein
MSTNSLSSKIDKVARLLAALALSASVAVFVSDRAVAAGCGGGGGGGAPSSSQPPKVGAPPVPNAGSQANQLDKDKGWRSRGQASAPSAPPQGGPWIAWPRQ